MTTLVLWSALLACVRRDDVRVRVTRTLGADQPPVENLTLFVGGSKSWWPRIGPGESVSVVLSPEGEPPQPTMTYSVAGRRFDWRGPHLAAGSGYVIAIAIGADGQATERHCSTPCSLP